MCGVEVKRKLTFELYPRRQIQFEKVRLDDIVALCLERVYMHEEIL